MEDRACILTIDDEAGIRQNLSAYLEDCGYRTLEAADGSEGVEVFRRERPDVVLCDLRMPTMDGLQVLALIREESPETPVIVVSGAGTTGDVVEALRNGAWDYLTKPIEDMEFLASAVTRALNRARLARENREYRESLELLVKELKHTLSLLEEDEKAGRNLQLRLLPPDGQVLLGCTFKRRLYPSTYLSGDFVDYFLLDANRIGFYMIDVSGHGAASAFLTVMLRTTVNQYCEAYRQDEDHTAEHPERTLERLNNDLCHQQLDKYLTIFYGIIDLGKHSLTWSAGGQFPYPILSDGQHPRFLDAPGFPVGLVDTADFASHSIALPERFSLLLVSDGVLELLNDTETDDVQTLLLERLEHTGLDIEAATEVLGVEERHNLPDDVTFLLVTNAQ
ncbi:MAG: response regulator [Candidatus Thiodiazotropha sp. (ex Monitilora ramsayi)]|nr:response regulator [Candidatus Thiodiazotropha sp. (ex Monitilora ramsayi)]